MVTKIAWGANAVATLTYENEEDAPKKEIEGKLKMELANIKGLIGKADTTNETQTATDQTKKEADGAFAKPSTPLLKGLGVGFGYEQKSEGTLQSEKIQVLFNADFLPKGEANPTNVEKAMALIEAIPKRLGESEAGKGKAITIYLLPLSLLKQNLDDIEIPQQNIYHPIPDSMVIKMEQFFETIEDLQQTLKDLHAFSFSNREMIAYDSSDKIEKFSKNFDAALVELRDKLKQHLFEVRSGKEPILGLENVKKEFEMDEYSTQKVRDFIQEHIDLKEKIAHFKDFIGRYIFGLLSWS